jgi:hypothetical protein
MVCLFFYRATTPVVAFLFDFLEHDNPALFGPCWGNSNGLEFGETQL